MFKKREHGFTLIELLVVIAIIGVLSSVVLASLNSARAKGMNSKIKAQLANARASAAVYNDTNNSYNGIAGDVIGNCTTADSMFTDVASGMAEFSKVANYPAGVTLTCYSTADNYAVSANLATPDDGSTHWCIDSSGASKGIVGAITGPAC